MRCEQCNIPIPIGDEYVLHNELLNIFCTHDCADAFDKQFRETRINEIGGEEEEEDLDDDNDKISRE